MPFIDDSIITIPFIPAIYTGTDEPNNPDVGMIWNEIDTSGNFEKWEAIDNSNYQWRSVEKSAATSQMAQLSLNNATRVHYFAVDNNSYDAIIKEFIVNYTVLNSIASTQFVTLTLQRVIEAGAGLTSTDLYSHTIVNTSSNKFFKTKKPLNYLYPVDSSNKTSIRLNVTTNTSINVMFYAHLIYHLYK